MSVTKLKMISVYIDEDEWYPVYSPSVTSKSIHKVDVPLATYRKWEKVLESFEEIQKEMGDYRDKQYKKEGR